jgi:hypothetical protein
VLIDIMMLGGDELVMMMINDFRWVIGDKSL